MTVSRIEEAEKVRDTVQVNNPLKSQNNIEGMRSPLTMNYHAQKVNQMQNAAGVVISLNGGYSNNTTQSNNMMLSNIDMNLFAAD